MAIYASDEVRDNEPVEDRSYGIIPIRPIPSTSPSTELASTISTANTQVLLIKQKSGNPLQSTYWAFPKGHVESYDLSNIHTAIRETHEEAGLIIPESGILFKDAEGLTERYRSRTKGCVKEVRYWIGLAGGEAKVKIEEPKVIDARWLVWREALELITFERGRELLRRAMELLDRDGQIQG
jgi:8-oxo-dGTP pyrophosphatase MutT (NUDIX family)